MKRWKRARLRVIAYRRGAETSCNWARALWPLVYRRGNWIIHCCIFIKESGSSPFWGERGVGMMIARKFYNGKAHQGFSVTSQPTCKISANYLWICTIWNFPFWTATATKITLQGTMSLTDTSYNSTRPTVGLAQPWKLPPGSQKHC